MVYVFLAPGFEESEALVPVDCLRRCDQQVQLVGIGDNIIMGSHGITVVTDITDNEVELNDESDMIVLPGGMPGTLNLEKSAVVQSAIDFCVKNDKYVAAICAAPSILGHKGLLKGHKAVCYTGFESQLEGAEVLEVPVVVSGKFVTARGAGVSIQFGLKLVELLTSKEKSDKLRDAILWEK